jgi:hypothetical protein
MVEASLSRSRASKREDSYYDPPSYMVLAVKHGVTLKTIYNIARANRLQRKDRKADTEAIEQDQ